MIEPLDKTTFDGGIRRNLKEPNKKIKNVSPIYRYIFYQYICLPAITEVLYFQTTRALVNDNVRGIQSIAQTDRVHDCILDVTVSKAKAL